MTEGASMKRAAFLSEAIRIAPEGKSLSSGWPFCPQAGPFVPGAAQANRLFDFGVE